MSAANAAVTLPDYLSTPTSFIKALRASSDPPEAGWPTKVEIALQGWSHPTFTMPHKGQVLRDWILDSWIKSRIGEKNTLLCKEYHELLHSVLAAAGPSTNAPSQVVGSFFASLCKTNKQDRRLLQLAAQSFQNLYAMDDAAMKSDAWIDCWRSFLEYLSLSSVIDYEAMRGIESLISSGIQQGQAASSNLKKNVQTVTLAFPAYSLAISQHPSLHRQLSWTMASVLFQPSVLTPSAPFLPIWDLISAAKVPTVTAFTGALTALPELFDRLVDIYRRHRHVIFTQASSSKTPHDVFIAAKEREAVRAALQQALDIIAETQAVGQLQMTDVVWKARLSLWQAVAQWNGYVEREETWGRIVEEAARQASSALSSTDMESRTRSVTDVGHLLGILATLERLDHGRTNINAHVLQWTIAVPTEHRTTALDLLSALLRYHVLTHSLEEFFDLIGESLLGLFSDDLPESAIQPLYQLVVTGPLLDQAFRDDLVVALRTVGSAKQRGNTWNGIARGCLQRMARETADTAARKRKRDTSAGHDGLLGVHSRLLVCCMEAMRDDISENHEDTLLQVETFANSLDNDSSSERSKTSWAGGIMAAAKLRIFRSLEALRCRQVWLAGEYNDSVVQTEIVLEQLLFRLHRIAMQMQVNRDLPPESEPLLDSILDCLSSIAEGQQAEVQSLWEFVGMNGISLFEAAATPLQLDRLIVLIANAVTSFPEVRVRLGAANIWEQQRFKSAMHRKFVSGFNGKAVALLNITPSTYFDRAVRLRLTEIVYSDRTLCKALPWVNRLPTDQKNLVVLTRNTATLLQLIQTGMEQQSSEVQRASVQIITDIFTFCCRAPDDHAQLLVNVAESLCSNVRIAHSDDTVSYHIELIDRLITAVSSREAALYPKSVRSTMEKTLSIVVDRKPALEIWSKSDLQAWDCATRLVIWLARSPISEYRTSARRVLKVLLGNNMGEVSKELLPRLVETVLTCLADEEVVYVAVLIWQFHPDLHIGNALRGRIGGNVSEAIAICVQLLTTVSTDASSAPAKVLQSLCSESTDAVMVRTAVNAVLGAAESETQLLTSVADVFDVKSSMFLHEDVSCMMEVLHHILSTSAATERLGPIITLLVTLVRRRPDLIRSSLSSLVDILSAIFPVLRSGTNSGAEDGQILAARLVARLLISASQIRMSVKQQDDSNPLAKHAPAILVAYIRVAADPRGGLPPLVKRALEPGIFALCNLVTSGGRVNARGREGEGIGTPFGLGEGVGFDGERELWADMWQNWSKSRYAGKG